MKRMLIISDSHGNKTGIETAIARSGDINALIHLGDYVRDTAGFGGSFKVYTVKGNGDIGSFQKEERMVSFGGKKVLMLHGHRQGVKYGLLKLSFYAQQKGADIVLFGHTHLATEQYDGSVLLYNPGSLWGMNQTYGIMEIDDNGAAKFKTYKL